AAEDAELQAAVLAGTAGSSGFSASRPNSGPGVSSRNSHCAPSVGRTPFSSWMLPMVMEKPMQLAMVSAEPTSSRGALAALSAENWGESPTTTIPQNSKNARNAGPGAAKSSGESTQQMPEARSWAKAT